MAMLQIPIPADTAFFRMRQTLDGGDYVLDFAWNGRADAWYLSLYSPDGEHLAGGFKIVSNRFLLQRQHWNPAIPAGEFFAYDPTNSIGAAGYDQLGTQIELFYIEAADVAVIEAAALEAL